MKLFAYEHPSGPVHEVEVTLGDTVLGGVCLQPRTPRNRVDGGDEAPQDRRPVARRPRARGRAVSRGFILDGAAPHAPAATTAKQTRAGPPTQVQDRAGHAGVCVGIKLQTAHVVAVTASARRRGVREGPRILNSLRDFRTGPTPKSSRPRSSTSPSAARSSTTTLKRSRRSASRRTTRCAPSPSR